MTWPPGRKIASRSFSNFLCDPVSVQSCRTVIRYRGSETRACPSELSWLGLFRSSVTRVSTLVLFTSWLRMAVWDRSLLPQFRCRQALIEVCRLYKDTATSVLFPTKCCFYSLVLWPYCSNLEILLALFRAWWESLIIESSANYFVPWEQPQKQKRKECEM
jgi:hypothetical protein